MNTVGELVVIAWAATFFGIFAAVLIVLGLTFLAYTLIAPEVPRAERG